jgi:pimeloyl-ACP methyl ester carboxylesterase
MAIADDLSRINIPAHVVWGARDPFLDVSYAHRLANDLRCSVEVIPGGRHFLPEDHPELIASVIQRFSEKAFAVSRR